MIWSELFSFEGEQTTPQQAERVRHSQINFTINLLSYGHLALIPFYISGAILFGQVSTGIEYWLTAALLYALASYVVIYMGYHRTRPKDSELNRWARKFLIHNVLLGVIGSCFVFLLVDDALQNVANFYLLVIFVVLPWFGSAMMTAFYWPVHVAWTGPALLILEWKLISDDMMMQQWVWVVSVAMAWLVSMLQALLTYRQMRESYTLRFKNEALLTEIRNASRQKDFLFAAASHDIRQPMQAMELFLSALEPKLDRDDQRKLLEQAHQSSHALRGILDSLMDISRLDAGEVEVDKQTIILQESMQLLDDEWRTVAEKKGLSFRCHIPSRLLWLNTDRVLLERLIRNLLSNAIRHTVEGGIMLAARKRGQSALIEVYDTGPGIPESERQNIFSEFYQLNNPERDRSKGVGLGLSIVKRLLPILDCQVSLRSIAGRGSRFSVSMQLFGPSGDKQLPVQHSVKVVQEEDVLMGLFILVIEDEEAVRTGLLEVLRAWQCEVLLAESCEAAMRELIEDKYPAPDMILADYRLRNGKNGIDAVIEVRNHFSSRIEACIVTGDADQQIKERADAQCCQLLKKPLDSDQLYSMISDSIVQSKGGER